MRFTFTISAEVARLEGKFATRDELEEQIRETLEAAEPSQLDGENGGSYEVVSWEIEAAEAK